MTEKPKDLFLLEGISHLCFNKARTQCALSKKDSKIYIYDVPDIADFNKWKFVTILDTHIQYISAIDWNPNTNKIVSASYDKTCAVWSFENGKWNTENLVFNTKVGYLTASWNSRGDKIVAGTSGKHLVIAYFNTDTRWWIGQNIKAHKSSVVCAKICPKSLFVISGSTDLHVYISSCYSSSDDAFISSEDKPLCKPFGQVIYDFTQTAWVTAVNWNISGSLAFAASQNSTIGIIDFKNDKNTVIPVTHSPASMIVPINDNSFYAVSHDREIYHYELVGSNWTLKENPTKYKESGGSGSGLQRNTTNNSISSGSSGGVQNALKNFQSSNVKKKTSLIVTTEQNPLLHPTTISSITMIQGKLITTDFAGFVKCWNI